MRGELLGGDILKNRSEILCQRHQSEPSSAVPGVLGSKQSDIILRKLNKERFSERRSGSLTSDTLYTGIATPASLSHKKLSLYRSNFACSLETLQYEPLILSVQLGRYDVEYLPDFQFVAF